MATLLEELNTQDLNTFRKDFLELLRVVFELNKIYQRGLLADNYLKKLEEIIKLFNKKYKGLKLIINPTYEELRLQIFLKEKDLKTLFLNVASKIDGLMSIGSKGFDEVNASDHVKISNKLETVDRELYLTYFQPELGSIPIYLEYNKKNKAIELHYGNEIYYTSSPEFILCAYYAIKEGIDPKIKLYEELILFSFSEHFNEEEFKEYLDKFNPRMEE